MLRPLDDNVVIEPKKPDEKTETGILLPNARHQTQEVNEGTVVALGPGKLNIKTGERLAFFVKVGDRVLYNWGGSDVEINKKKFRILHESDILAVID